MEVKSSNMEVKRVFRDTIDHVDTQWVIESTLVSLFVAFSVAHFRCFIFKSLCLGFEVLLKGLRKHLPENSAKTAFR